MKIFRNEALIYSEDYIYEDERVSRIDFYSTNKSWFDSTVFLLQYSGTDKIVIVNYRISNGEMTEFLKDSLQFQNSLLIQRTNFVRKQGNWTPQFKYEYEYANGLLTNEIYYTNDHDNWDEAFRFVYEYEDKKLKSAINYQDDALQFILSKEVADYDEGKLASVVHSRYHSGELKEWEKYIFQYEDQNVLSIDYYTKGETWNNNGAITFSYDEMNNLDTVIDNRPVLWPETLKVYYYEKGISNYSQILDPGHGIMNKWLSPHPINSVPPIL